MLCNEEYYTAQNALITNELFANIPGLSKVVTGYTDDRPYLSDAKAIQDFISKTDPNLWIEHPMIFAACRSDCFGDDHKWQTLSEYYGRLQDSATEQGKLFKWLVSELKTEYGSSAYHRIMTGIHLDFFLGRLDDQGLTLHFSHFSQRQDDWSLFIWRDVKGKASRFERKLTRKEIQVPEQLLVEVDKLANATNYCEAISVIQKLVQKCGCSLEMFSHNQVD